MAVGIMTLAGSFYATGVKAQDNGRGPNDTIIQKLVAKFGLNEADVQAVFDEERAERQTEMQARFEERLTQAVTDGKITEEQKAAILAKRAEGADCRVLEDWATENGIDADLLRSLMGGPGGPGMGGGGPNGDGSGGSGNGGPENAKNNE